MNAISAIHSQSPYHRPTVAPAQPPDQAQVNNKAMTNPARSAQTALIDRADLANKPFGSLVSLFAQGLPLPPFENASAPTPPSDEESVTSSSDTEAQTILG
jgi:hypothetical protein